MICAISFVVPPVILVIGHQPMVAGTAGISTSDTVNEFDEKAKQ